MTQNKKVRILKVLYFLFALMITSCKSEKCEGFNLKRMPFDLKYYKKPLKYSNGVDTITLYGTVSQFSKESRLSGLSNPTCDPSLSIDYKGKPHIITMSFYFEYYPESDYTKFTLSLNMSRSMPIKIDSAFLSNLKKNEEVVYQKMADNYNNEDSSRTLKKFSMQNMRVTDFEFLDGKRWYLVR
ncbi:hypothetical protein [Fluviicola taffensis]|uniref:Lipoprotein n=1 Tax=Fluviicola taffensis (strain DSM 16823 / NCIMB 13979 / RW262) TaxID=755732 RepID=F2IAI9_FLUTR|nr:hypothetical protein [Fluviicola taffensis]AEA43125.1 hypothetical protein Fluta_1129 [Fluviicola taffensis DSM 16823]